ncbi:MAG: riboflavin synthase [Bacillota bacterium]
MFTGIIEEIGVLRRISSSGGGTSLVIKAKEVLTDLKIGDSVAISGPCLTVTSLDRDSFTVWVMPETLEKTNLQNLSIGEHVNLERAMSLGGRLGGHLVSGHIDAVIALNGRRLQGDAIILSFEAPGHLLRYIVPKGSVALDGVSLTVIDVDESGFSVGLIPHTASWTTLGQKESGSMINLEVDMIGKYIEKMLIPRLDGGKDQKQTITMDLLQKKGYL